MDGGDLVLVDQARAADERWGGELPGMGGHTEVQSFRGFYAILYRSYTTVAHPRYQGLNHVVEQLGPNHQRVRLEGHHEGNGPYGLATVVFTLGLYVAAASLGWPQSDEVAEIFGRYPYG